MKYIALFSIFLISSSFAMDLSEKRILTIATTTGSRPSQMRSASSLAVSAQTRCQKENEACCMLLGKLGYDLAALAVTSPVWLFNDALVFAEKKLKVE